LARIANKLAPNHKQSEQRIAISSGVRIPEGFEAMREPFKYDPELMEKARWIVERGLHRPPEHEIEKQLELPLPMPREKSYGHN
jgi:hypothetical protein